MGTVERFSFSGNTKKKILILIVMTFVQRSSAFLLTFLVYLGFGLSGTAMYQILLLQAAIYVAVDMLPVPGAQGITEAMYGKVFLPVFSGQYLVPAMCVTRGVGFYLMLVIGALWVLKFIIKKSVQGEKRRVLMLDSTKDMVKIDRNKLKRTGERKFA